MSTAQARHILVQTEQECLEIKDTLQKGEQSFEELAKLHSLCPSKQQGGDLGSFGPGMMVPEFDKVVFSAPLHEVQGPIQTQFGFHLLEVTARSE